MKFHVELNQKWFEDTESRLRDNRLSLEILKFSPVRDVYSVNGGQEFVT